MTRQLFVVDGSGRVVCVSERTEWGRFWGLVCMGFPALYRHHEVGKLFLLFVYFIVNVRQVRIRRVLVIPPKKWREKCPFLET